MGFYKDETANGIPKFYLGTPEVELPDSNYPELIFGETSMQDLINRLTAAQETIAQLLERL